MHLNDDHIQDVILRNADFPGTETDHINQCVYCAERVEWYRSYYSSVGDSLADNEFADNEMLLNGLRRNKEVKLLPGSSIKILAPARISSLLRNKKFIPALRTIWYFYPKSTAGGIISLAALIFIALISFNKYGASTQIEYAEAKNGFLMAYNHNGDRAWSKFIHEGFDRERISNSSEEPLPKYISVEDIDGDGKNEILVSKAFVGVDVNDRAPLICLDSKGTIKWEYRFHRDISMPDMKITDRYSVRTFITADLNLDGQKEIYVIFGHEVYYPTFVVRLDARTGGETGAYFHSGGLVDFAQKPFVVNNRPLLLLYGENNSFDKACLFALNYEQFTGHGPSDPSRTPLGMKQGNNSVYILLPPNFPLIFSSDKRNRVIEMGIDEKSNIRISTRQRYFDEKLDLIYYFNNKLECTGIDATDGALVALNKLRRAGKTNINVDTGYLNSIRSQILYLK